MPYRHPAAWSPKHHHSNGRMFPLKNPSKNYSNIHIKKIDSPITSTTGAAHEIEEMKAKH